MDIDLWVQATTEWLLTIPAVWIYLYILGIAFVENVVPPVPGDLFVVYGGYLVGLGMLDGLYVWVAATVGGTVGFITLFSVGYQVGEKATETWWLRWFSSAGIEKATGWMKKRGQWVVLFNRFLSGARSVISLAAGISRLSPGRTFVSAAASAAVWCGLLVFGGYYVGEQWKIIDEWIRTYSTVVFSLMAAGVFAMVLRSFLNRRNRK